MNSQRTVILSVTAHKRRQKDRDVTITNIKEYLTVQKEKGNGDEE